LSEEALGFGTAREVEGHLAARLKSFYEEEFWPG
jgi:hypothetical protein